MENGLTKAMTIIALTCFLVVGAAATSILGRDSVPAARAEMTSPIVRSPVANRESKQDKLGVATLALASFEPPQTSSLSEPLRQAYAASSAADIEAAGATTSAVTPPAAPAKPKLATRPAPQKPYALLSDAQIAGIKERLKLSADQEHYWPAVEIRAARGGPEDSCDTPGRSARDRRADRSRRRGSPAAEIGGDAAVVSVARRSEAGSAHARPPDRAGKGRGADLTPPFRNGWPKQAASPCQMARAEGDHSVTSLPINATGQMPDIARLTQA